jgi:hypothetical protein
VSADRWPNPVSPARSLRATIGARWRSEVIAFTALFGAAHHADRIAYRQPRCAQLLRVIPSHRLCDGGRDERHNGRVGLRNIDLLTEPALDPIVRRNSRIRLAAVHQIDRLDAAVAHEIELVEIECRAARQLVTVDLDDGVGTLVYVEICCRG